MVKETFHIWFVGILTEYQFCYSTFPSHSFRLDSYLFKPKFFDKSTKKFDFCLAEIVKSNRKL